MDQKEDYKEKYEKGKLHTRYLLIIAVILAIIGFSLAFGKNSIALGQISMASTVSSIILSAIAIFMSISGENKLNYTHDKLVETSDRMSGITANIEKANSLLDNTINQKLTKIDDIFDRLESIGQSVGNVEKEMLNRTPLRIDENITVSVSSDILWRAYNNMINDVSTYSITAKAVMMYVVVSSTEHAQFSIDSMEEYAKSVTGTSDRYFEGYALGLFEVFLNLGIAKKENIKYFAERMKLSQSEKDEVKKFL